MARRMRIVVGLVLMSVFVCTALFAATPLTPKNIYRDMDKAMLKRVADFMVKKNHPDIIPVKGRIADIRNGYFLKVDAIQEKTKKDYYIEILCNKNYADWSLLACIESSQKTPLKSNTQTK